MFRSRGKFGRGWHTQGRHNHHSGRRAERQPGHWPCRRKVAAAANVRLCQSAQCAVHIQSAKVSKYTMCNAHTKCQSARTSPPAARVKCTHTYKVSKCRFKWAKTCTRTSSMQKVEMCNCTCNIHITHCTAHAHASQNYAYVSIIVKITTAQPWQKQCGLAHARPKRTQG